MTSFPPLNAHRPLTEAEEAQLASLDTGQPGFDRYAAAWTLAKVADAFDRAKVSRAARKIATDRAHNEMVEQRRAELRNVA